MQKMIVAVDGSAYSLTAARVAIDLARCYGLEEVCFVHVVSLKPGQLGTKEYPERPDLPHMWPVFQEPLAMAREAGVAARTEVLFGNAAETLVHHVRKEAADLLIVGSLGESGVKEFLLGSVAARLITHAPCSVLVVRPGFRLSCPLERPG
jgi:nucleotide-binding universal stress UspA family protein